MGLLKSLWREVTGRRNRQVPNDPSDAASPGHGDELDNMARAHAVGDADQRKTLVAQLASMVEARPSDMQARRLLAEWHLGSGQLALAEQHFRQALQMQPLDARGHEGLGLCLLHAGRVEEAYLRLETAAKLAPSSAEILVHWGLTDLALGNLTKAAGKFQRAIDRTPDNPHAWHNLALVSLKQGKTAQSIEQLGRSLQLQPDHALAHSNLALALMQDDRLAEATQAALRATELKPGQARMWVVLSDIHQASGNLAAADEALRQALVRDPGHEGAQLGLAKLAMARGDLTAARVAFEGLLVQAPGNADAQAGLGQLLLLLGDWGSAWPLYEARRLTATTPVRTLPYVEWQGEQGLDERLLVHAEQGLGDIILFASCLPDLSRRCNDVVVEVPPRLEGLFARSFPWARVIGHEPTDHVSGWLEMTPPVQRQVPIGTLPRWLRQRSEDFGAAGPFLVADGDKVEAWRSRLVRDDDRRPLIGVTWRGGLAFTGKYQRSLSLSLLAATLDRAGAKIVSLQHGETAKDLAQCQAETGVVIEPGLDGFGDLDDLAALTMACDGIVSVCCTQAHLTGALGQRGLILVPSIANWRYGATGSRMAWYRSLELARQTEPDDWQAPLERVRTWVEEFKSGDTTPR